MTRPKPPKTRLLTSAIVLCFLLVVILPGVISMVVPGAVGRAEAATTDCTDVFTPLSTFITQDAAANQSTYVQAQNAAGVPWELLAAIHYRETNMSLTEPGDGLGLFQDNYAVASPGTTLNSGQFYQEALKAAQLIQSTYALRNSPNAATVTPQALTPNDQDINLIKNTLYSWNGRATSYAQQAAQYGFSSSTQPYEGSPYVMNRFDCQRDRMGIITQDGGAISSVDTRYGAFTVYARLQGDSYWLSMLQPYTWVLSTQDAYTDSDYSTEYTNPANPTVAPGQKAYLKLVARNIGQNTWSQSVVHLGTTYPTDRASIFADNSWLSPERIQMQESTVAPGATATFEFSVTAPSTPGTYVEHFSVVADGVTWLNDPDAYYTINVVNPTTADNTQNTGLTEGQFIAVGQHLMSPDSQSTLSLLSNGNLVLYGSLVPLWNNNASSSSAESLVLQNDGNLVEYNSSGQPLWASGTSGSGNYLAMQTDGNLVLYSSSNSVLWSTSTTSIPNHLSEVDSSMAASGIMYPGQYLQTADRAYSLVLQNDGNLVEYNSSGQPLWASGTSGSGNYLAMQTDGNLVLYSSNGKPLWATATGGSATALTLQPNGVITLSNGGSAIWQTRIIRAGQYLQTADRAYSLVLQNDGNLVEYNSSGQPLWASGTSGSGNYLAMQTDGNLVLYSSNGKPLWATATGGRNPVLAIQEDGNVVVYNGNGTPMWALRH